MITRQVFDVYFDQGAKQANEMLHEIRDAALISTSSASAEDAANLLILRLLLQRDLGELGEVGLRDTVGKMDALEIRDGSRVVYNLLLLDLARERGVSLTFAKSTRAGGPDLDWDLMQRMKRATPTFTHQINELIQAQGKPQ